MTSNTRSIYGGDAFPTYAELLTRPGELAGTAWGVFGGDDQLGTLNHLTPAVVASATSLVRHGLRFSLNLPLNAFDPPLISHRGQIEHHVFGLNEFHRDERVDSLFTQASTQIDGLRHFAHPDHGFYNNTPSTEVAEDTVALGIHHVADAGIVGRGILIDVAAYREAVGRPLDHSRSEQIPVSDLDAALEWQDTAISPGDLLLIRTGWINWYRTHQQATIPLVSAGLAQREETAAWLWDHQIAVAAADNIALEAWPADSHSEITTQAESTGQLENSTHTGMLHRILIPLLGLTIGELWDLDSLANHCHRDSQYETLIVAEPLNLTGGVGSPANAIAIV